MKKTPTRRAPGMWRFTIWIACLVIVLHSCRDENLDTVEEKQSAALMQMQYTLTKTTFVNTGNGERSPSVTKEKINLELYDGDEFRMRVDILNDETTAFSVSEAKPANDVPVASHYIMEKGHYVMYDTRGNVMLENEMPELNFDGLAAKLKNSKINTANLPAMLASGSLFLNFDDQSPIDPVSRKASGEYETYEQSYTDELDGKWYRQQTIVSKKDQSLQAVHLYDESGKLLSKTTYRYESNGEHLTLKSTHDTYLDVDGAGNEILFNTISDYDNFSLNVNLPN